MSVAGEVAVVRKAYMPDVVPYTVGHAVVAVGSAAERPDAVAAWQVSVTGHPTGAWVFPGDTLKHGEDAARALLGIVQRRVVVAWRVATALDLLARLAGGPPERTVAVELLVLVEEIRGYRAMLPARARLSSAVESFLDGEYGGVGEAAAAAGVAGPRADRAVGEALLTTRLVAFLAALWQEVLRRGPRSGLPGGRAEPLPPRWMALVRAAATGRRGVS